MNCTDPTDAHIVYLNVKPTLEGDNRLNKLCSMIIEIVFFIVV
jgi:hypothetical protein